MIQKADIIKMAKQVFKRSQGSQEIRLIHPHREWHVLVFLSVVLLAIGIIYSAYSYIHFDTIQDRIEIANPKVVRYAENDINRMLERYGERRAAFDDNVAVFVPTLIQVAATTSTSTIDIVATSSEPVASSTVPETDTAKVEVDGGEAVGLSDG